MTPLERAALAIFDHCSRQIEDRANSPEELLREWEAVGGSNREKWIDAARAVLQAIREPSEKMIEAAIRDAGEMFTGTEVSTWPAMIDAALEEG